MNGIDHKISSDRERQVVVVVVFCVRARLHQASESMLQQLCDDASNTVLTENNGVAWRWVATPFWSDSIVFNENSIASIIAELSQHRCWYLA